MFFLTTYITVIDPFAPSAQPELRKEVLLLFAESTCPRGIATSFVILWQSLSQNLAPQNLHVFTVSTQPQLLHAAAPFTVVQSFISFCGGLLLVGCDITKLFF